MFYSSFAVHQLNARSVDLLTTEMRFTSAGNLTAGNADLIREMAGDDVRFAMHLLKESSYPADVISTRLKRYGKEFLTFVRAAGENCDNPQQSLDNFIAREAGIEESLSRICGALESCRDSRGIVDSKLFNLICSYPEQTADLIESSGTGALALFHKYGENCFSQAVSHRELFEGLFARFPRAPYGVIHEALNLAVPCEVLEKSTETLLVIADSTRRAAVDTFSRLPVIALEKRPERLVDVATIFREHTPAVFTMLGERISEVSPGEISSILNLSKKVPELFEIDDPCNIFTINYTEKHDITSECSYAVWRVDQFLKALPSLHQLADEFGEALQGVLTQFGPAIAGSDQAQELKAVTQSLRDADLEDSDIAGALADISPEMLKIRPGLHKKIAEVAGSGTPRIFESLKTCRDWAMVCPEVLVDLSEHLHSFAAEVISKTNPSLFLEYPDVMMSLARKFSYKLSFCKDVLTRDFLREHGRALLEHLEYHGEALRGLLLQFKGDYFRKEVELRDEIDKLKVVLGGGAADFFEIVPAELWSDKKMLESCLFYEEATGPEYRRRRDGWFENPSEDMKRARELFGIRHFYRFKKSFSSSGENPDSPGIIRKVLENYDRGTEVKGPLFVEVLPRSDHNEAYQNAWLFFAKTSETHNVFYLESGSTGETTNLLRRIACLRGVDPSGNPIHPIEHVTISHHGNENIIRSGFRPEGSVSDRANNPDHVSRADEAVFEEWARYIDPRGTIYLNACSTAKKTAEGNFAESLKKKLPSTVRVIASRQSHSGGRYILNSYNEVIGVAPLVQGDAQYMIEL